MNVLLQLLDWWGDGQLYPDVLLLELRDMVRHACGLYGVDLDFYNLLHCIENDVTFVDSIMEEYDECRLLSQAVKAGRDDAKLGKFFKKAKDTLDSVDTKDLSEEVKLELKELHKEAELHSSEWYQGYELEVKAILYLQQLYGANR